MTANIQSISALINKALQPKGISTRVAQKADTLQIFLQSAQPISKEAVTTFLTNGVKKLNVDGISKLAIYAKQTGETAVSWAAQADIASVPAKTSCQEPQVETAKPSKKQSDFSALKTSIQKSPVPTAKPAKKQSGSPWLGAGTLITLIISLPTIVLFLIPAAIALGAQTFSYSKGERDKTKLGELSCKYFIGSFWGLVALTGVSITLFPDLHKPTTVATTTPSPVAAPEDNSVKNSVDSTSSTTSTSVALSSNIGEVDETGVKITVDVPKDPACSRTHTSVKMDTFEKCLLEGLTHVQVANALGYRGELQTKSGNIEIHQWNDGVGKYLSVTFANGKLMSKAQTGLEPGS